MNIFSQENFNGVQEVIRNTGVQNGMISKEPAVKDEMGDLNRQSEHIQELIEKIDSLPDPSTREMMQECIQEILSFYGHGLEKILNVISKGNTSAAKDIYNDLIGDSFISGLLLIHDLHPLDLKTRLYQALEKVSPYINSHGGSVELVSLDAGVAKIKLAGSCKTCPSSESTLELGIRQAIEENCPDLSGLEVEGITSSPKTAGPADGGRLANNNGWKIIEGLNDMPGQVIRTIQVSGVSLVICRINNQLYAYRNICPACEMSLDNGTLENNILGCPLGHRYDVQLAGRCIDDPELHLEPFPLLREGQLIKVSV